MGSLKETDKKRDKNLFSTSLVECNAREEDWKMLHNRPRVGPLEASNRVPDSWPIDPTFVAVRRAVSETCRHWTVAAVKVYPLPHIFYGVSCYLLSFLTMHATVAHLIVYPLCFSPLSSMCVFSVRWWLHGDLQRNRSIWLTKAFFNLVW